MTPEERVQELFGDHLGYLILNPLALEFKDGMVTAIRAAIVAEREACARVASNYGRKRCTDGECCAEQIATTIRAVPLA